MCTRRYFSSCSEHEYRNVFSEAKDSLLDVGKLEMFYVFKCMENIKLFSEVIEIVQKEINWFYRSDIFVVVMHCLVSEQV